MENKHQIGEGENKTLTSSLSGLDSLIPAMLADITRNLYCNKMELFPRLWAFF